MEQESRVNNPKSWIAQLFCRHHGEWFRRQEPYFNLSGETQYKVCTKCGKKLDERFIPNFENRTIQYWGRKGLKSVRKNPYVMYRQQDIIRYMEEHPEDWNAARVTDDTLFMQYPWFKEKRKNDISHKYNWTQTEVSQMKMLRKQGFTIREIAEKMNRSESSIKYKLYEREKSNGRS